MSEISITNNMVVNLPSAGSYPAGSIISINVTSSGSGYDVPAAVVFNNTHEHIDNKIRFETYYNDVTYDGEVIPIGGKLHPRMDVDITHRSYQFNELNDRNPKFYDPIGMVCVIGNEYMSDVQENEHLKAAYDEYFEILTEALQNQKVIDAFNNFKIIQELTKDNSDDYSF